MSDVILATDFYDTLDHVKSYQDFLGACFPSDQAVRNSGLRRGQHAFNVLSAVRPDLSEQVRATGFDPFYQDEILPTFFRFVEDHWDD